MRKILFDLRVLSLDWSGIAAYTYNLFKAVCKSNLDYDITYIIKNEDILDKIKKDLDISGLKTIVLNKGIYDLSNFSRIPKIIKSNNFDIYLTTQFFWPYLFIPSKVICMIHDIIPLSHPHLLKFSLKTRYKFVFRIMTRLSLKLSDRVIVNSQTTLDSLKESFGNNLTKNCKILYPALMNLECTDKISMNTDEINRFGRKYILYVGRHDEYKNLLRLVKAYYHLKKDNFPYKLVISGRIDPRYCDALKESIHLGLEQDIVFTDFVTDELLRKLYINAGIVVQPSIIEGFGLTALEPLIYGKICVVSNIPCFKEALKDSVIYFDPFNYNDIKQKISQAYELSDLQIRELNLKGKEILGEYHYQKSVSEFNKILQF